MRGQENVQKEEYQVCCRIISSEENICRMFSQPMGRKNTLFQRNPSRHLHIILVSGDKDFHNVFTEHRRHKNMRKADLL
jgi:hypothetical protein